MDVEAILKMKHSVNKLKFRAYPINLKDLWPHPERLCKRGKIPFFGITNPQLVTSKRRFADTGGLSQFSLRHSSPLTQAPNQFTHPVFIEIPHLGFL